MGSFFVTTAIPYVNAEPHLGFALELVQADALACYHRLIGDDTWFLTGTDENSLTNVLAAERQGVTVRALVDRNADAFRALGAALDISHDDFIRTGTDLRHADGAQALWRACAAAGDVYRRSYRGLYCVRCERFYAVDELIGGRCPVHDVEPDVVEEENYFFRLSRHAGALSELLRSGALRIRPECHQREVEMFVARGLTDFSISRTQARARGWGIPVPEDPEQMMYVWFDALANYITALGYGSESTWFRRYWADNPRRVHVIGKDIVRFHGVYWPAMLLSAQVPPPTEILVHGFLSRDGRRMSKSSGTGVDPIALAQAWSPDAVRYWLLRHVPAAGDASYSDEAFADAYSADLANDLGNLVHRTVSMIHRYRAGAIPAPANTASRLGAVARAVPAALHRGLSEAWDPRLALDAVFTLVASANRAVEETTPWTLARRENAGDAAAQRQLDTVLWELAESLRLIAEALRPCLPTTAGRLAAQLGTAPSEPWCRALEWGGLQPGIRVGAPVPLFPRPVVT